MKQTILYLYHAVICSWNQPVLSNAGQVSYYNGSVSFWSSYVSFRVYCFANACDTLFLPRDWRPLCSGVFWERENVIFIFNRGESSFVVLLITLLSSSFVFLFFYTAAISSATSLICFILFILTFILFIVFLLAYHFKVGKQLLPRRFSPATTQHLAKRSFVLGTSEGSAICYTTGVRSSVH